MSNSEASSGTPATSRSIPDFHSDKIHDHHQQRLAIVYVRQSTPRQVIENRESTQLQYSLADKDTVQRPWKPCPWWVVGSVSLLISSKVYDLPRQKNVFLHTTEAMNAKDAVRLAPIVISVVPDDKAVVPALSEAFTDVDG